MAVAWLCKLCGKQAIHVIAGWTSNGGIKRNFLLTMTGYWHRGAAEDEIKALAIVRFLLDSFLISSERSLRRLSSDSLTSAATDLYVPLSAEAGKFQCMKHSWNCRFYCDGNFCWVQAVDTGEEEHNYVDHSVGCRVEHRDQGRWCRGGEKLQCSCVIAAKGKQQLRSSWQFRSQQRSLHQSHDIWCTAFADRKDQSTNHLCIIILM